MQYVTPINLSNNRIFRFGNPFPHYLWLSRQGLSVGLDLTPHNLKVRLNSVGQLLPKMNKKGRTSTAINFVSSNYRSKNLKTTFAPFFRIRHLPKTKSVVAPGFPKSFAFHSDRRWLVGTLLNYEFYELIGTTPRRTSLAGLLNPHDELISTKSQYAVSKDLPVTAAKKLTRFRTNGRVQMFLNYVNLREVAGRPEDYEIENCEAPDLTALCRSLIRTSRKTRRVWDRKYLRAYHFIGLKRTPRLTGIPNPLRIFKAARSFFSKHLFRYRRQSRTETRYKSEYKKKSILKKRTTYYLTRPWLKRAANRFIRSQKLKTRRVLPRNPYKRRYIRKSLTTYESGKRFSFYDLSLFRFENNRSRVLNWASRKRATPYLKSLDSLHQRGHEVRTPLEDSFIDTTEMLSDLAPADKTFTESMEQEDKEFWDAFEQFSKVCARKTVPLLYRTHTSKYAYKAYARALTLSAFFARLAKKSVSINTHVNLRHLFRRLFRLVSSNRCSGFMAWSRSVSTYRSTLWQFPKPTKSRGLLRWVKLAKRRGSFRRRLLRSSKLALWQTEINLRAPVLVAPNKVTHLARKQLARVDTNIEVTTNFEIFPIWKGSKFSKLDNKLPLQEPEEKEGETSYPTGLFKESFQRHPFSSFLRHHFKKFKPSLSYLQPLKSAKLRLDPTSFRAKKASGFYPLSATYSLLQPILGTLSAVPSAVLKTHVRFKPTYSFKFVRSPFFFHNFFSLNSATTFEIAKAGTRMRINQWTKYLVFPVANDIKVTVFRKLNRQKFLAQSRFISFNRFKHRRKPLTLPEKNAITAPDYRSYVKELLITKRSFTDFNKVLFKDHSKYEELLTWKFGQFQRVRIRRIRFKPGYGRLWRIGRAAAREIFNFPGRYQYTLTPKLQRMFFTHLRTYRDENYTMDVQFGLMKTRLAPDMWAADELLNKSYVFLNGHSCSNRSTKLFKRDFLQLVVNLKYYIMVRWLRNWFTIKQNRINKIFYRKFRPSSFNKEIKVVRRLPDWYYDLQYTFGDIPKFFEVDYFTLSAFVVYSPLYGEKWLPSRTRLIDPLIYQMYNWKYIT